MVSPMSTSCDLCAAARLTPWWYEDDVCWVAECESCGVPMVVWKLHGATPSPTLVEHMRSCLREVADRFGPPRYWLDDTLRTIPDHYHAHARRRPFA
jgi:hypothetical protein